MKKIFTLIVCLAAVASAVAANQVREVKAAPAQLKRVAVVPAQSKALENAIFSKKNDAATVGKRAIRANEGEEETVTPDVAYSLPVNGFHSYLGWVSGQYGYSYGISLYPAYTDITYKAQDGYGDTWEYFTDPWDDEQPLLASGKELTYQAPFGGRTLGVDQPLLTQDGNTVYQNGNSIRHGGAAEVFTDAGIDTDLMGHANVEHPILSTIRFFRPATKNSVGYTESNSLWSKEFREAGLADSAAVIGLAEYFPKLAVPYTVSQINVSAYVEITNAKGATFTAKIVSFDPETGAYDLDNPLAVGTCKFKSAVDWSLKELSFKLTHFIPDPEDPEYTLEETGPMVIDQDILVVFEFEDPGIEEFRPLIAGADYEYDDYIPGRYVYTLVDLYEGEGSDAEVVGRGIGDCSSWAWALQDDPTYYRPYSMMMGMDIEFPALAGPDRVVLPAEGGEETIEVISTKESDQWEEVALPEWLAVQAQDYGFHYTDSEEILYNGSTELTFTADALPEGETGRSFDLKISILGAEKVIKVIQGEVAPEFAKGDVNGDGAVGAADIACLVNVLAGLEEEAKYEGRADVTGDGAVSAADIAAIVNILAGLE